MKKFLNGNILFISIVLFFCISSIVIVTIVFLSPLVLNAEKDILKSDLNNSYINADYLDWKKTDLDIWQNFMIPKGWDIVSSNGQIQIYDSQNNLIAKGAVIGTNTSFINREAFLNEIVKQKIDGIEIKPIKDYIPVRNTNYAEISIRFLSKDIMTYRYISLPPFGDNVTEANAYNELFIVFFENAETKTNDLLDIAQAITFSYCFSE